MIVIDLLAGLLIVLGTLFLVAAALGVLRFPDFYTRLHAAGKGDTLGQALILLGLVLTSGLTLVSVKLGLIAFFIFILNPTATHALARGAWVAGVRPWMGGREQRFVQREGQLSEEEREKLFSPLHVEAQKGDGPWTT